jgi:molecular chaperone GrpE
MEFMEKDEEPDNHPQPGEASVESKPEADLAAAYEKAVAEKQEFHERLLRTQAELENFRKRLQREKEEFLQLATADLVRALLPTLDGLERALEKRDPSVPEQFYQGMELIYRQLLEVLTRAGLARIETEGRFFDPLYHEAVETVEAPGRLDHEIVEELQRGYKLKHRLLRPAMVKVAVTPKPDGPEGQEKQGESSKAGG